MATSPLAPRFLFVYRRLLLLHHSTRTKLNTPLPPQMASFGLSYIKSEFERHRDVVKTNKAEGVRFLDEWEDYERTMLGEKSASPIQQSELTDEQKGKLNELKASVMESFLPNDQLNKAKIMVDERTAREADIEITRVEAGNSKLGSDIWGNHDVLSDMGKGKAGRG